MKGTRFLALVIIGMVVEVPLTACKSRPDPRNAAAAAAGSVTGGDLKVAARDKVALYKNGPQQLTAPDALLSKNTPVRVIRKEFGYSFVSLESGQLGWVATEDLATPSESPTAPAPTAFPNTPESIFGNNVINGAAGGGDSAVVGHYRLPEAGQPASAASPAPTPTPTPTPAAESSPAASATPSSSPTP